MDALIPDVEDDLAVSATPFPDIARVKHGVAARTRVNGNLAGLSRVVHLDHGLYALTAGPAVGTGTEPIDGIALPVMRLSSLPGHSPIELVSRPGDAPGWIDARGGTIFVKAPEIGGTALITTYGGCTAAAMRDVTIRRLNVSSLARRREPPAMVLGNDISGVIESEITLHIERLGDRQFSSRQWAGNPNLRLRIEGISLRLLQGFGTDDVEYMGFYPGDKCTAWVSGGALCGSRGRGLPLTGFAIRLVPKLRPRFEVLYRGVFLEGGASPFRHNGEPCLSEQADDPLCAVNVEIIDHKARSSELASGFGGVVLDHVDSNAAIVLRDPILVATSAGEDEDNPAPQSATWPSLLDQVRYEIDLIKDQFDAKFYLDCYRDLEKKFDSMKFDPLEHFCLVGWRENRNPCDWFSVGYYRAVHLDVADSNWNPFAHYIAYGKDEGRKISRATHYVPAATVAASSEVAALRDQLATLGERLTASQRVSKALLAALGEGAVPPSDMAVAGKLRWFWPWARRRE